MASRGSPGSTYECTFRMWGPLGLAFSEACQVIKVLPDGQAESCGSISVGDRLTHVAGKGVASLRDADEALRAAARPLVLKFVRGDPDADDDDEDPGDGEFYSVTLKRDGPLGLQMGDYCRVAEVKRDSQAEDADCISQGDRLWKVDGIRMYTMVDVDLALRNPKRPLVLQFRRQERQEDLKEDHKRRDAELASRRREERREERGKDRDRDRDRDAGRRTSKDRESSPKGRDKPEKKTGAAAADLLDMTEPAKPQADDSFNPNGPSANAAQEAAFNPNAGQGGACGSACPAAAPGAGACGMGQMGMNPMGQCGANGCMAPGMAQACMGQACMPGGGMAPCGMCPGMMAGGMPMCGGGGQQCGGGPGNMAALGWTGGNAGMQQQMAAGCGGAGFPQTYAMNGMCPGTGVPMPGQWGMQQPMGGCMPQGGQMYGGSMQNPGQGAACGNMPNMACPQGAQMPQQAQLAAAKEFDPMSNK